MDEEEDVVLVIGGYRNYVPGSVEYDCSLGCGGTAWLAPSGQQFVKTQRAEVACPACGMRQMKEQGVEEDELELVPGAEEEARNYLDNS